MKLVYRNDASELARLAEDFKVFSESNSLDTETRHAFDLCLEEIMNNVISYALNDGDTHTIEVELTLENGITTAIIKDDGQPFDPLQEVPEPNLDTPIEDRTIGGLGVYFVKSLMDELCYQRQGNFNVFKMNKKLPEQKLAQ